MLVILNFLSILPSVILLYFYFSKKLPRIPFRVSNSIYCLFAGAFISLVAILVELLIARLMGSFFSSKETFWYQIIDKFFIIGFVEEAAKLLVVLAFLKIVRVENRLAGIFFFALVSLGFAFQENFFYSFLEQTNRINNLIFRSFTSYFLHISCTTLIGISWFAGGYKRSASKFPLLLFAVFWHGLYDLFLYFGRVPLALLVLLILLGRLFYLRKTL